MFAVVEGQTERRGVRLQVDGGRNAAGATARAFGLVLGIHDAIAVAERPAEIAAALAEVVDLIGRQVVAQPIAAVFAGPDGARLLVEGKAHGVAQSAREDVSA